MENCIYAAVSAARITIGVSQCRHLIGVSRAYIRFAERCATVSCTYVLRVARMHVGIDATYSTAATSTLRYVRRRNKFQSRNWKDSGLAEALLFASLRDRGYSASDIVLRVESSSNGKREKKKSKTLYTEFFECKILLNMDYVHGCGKSDLDKISRSMKYV